MPVPAKRGKTQACLLDRPDVTDRAATETDWSIELRTRDRQRKLVSKIEAATRRIAAGQYGHCAVTGEPTSPGRPEARPTATMPARAQDRPAPNHEVPPAA